MRQLLVLLLRHRVGAGGLGAMPAKRRARSQVEDVLGPRSAGVRRARPRREVLPEDHDDYGAKSDDSVDSTRQLGVQLCCCMIARCVVI